MSDLVERVARRLGSMKFGGSGIGPVSGRDYGENPDEDDYANARAAIAEVRRFDVERGPSDAEVEGSCEPLRELRGEPGADAVLRIAAKIRQEEPV